MKTIRNVTIVTCLLGAKLSPLRTTGLNELALNVLHLCPKGFSEKGKNLPQKAFCRFLLFWRSVLSLRGLDPEGEQQEAYTSKLRLQRLVKAKEYFSVLKKELGSL